MYFAVRFCVAFANLIEFRVYFTAVSYSTATFFLGTDIYCIAPLVGLGSSDLRERKRCRFDCVYLKLSNATALMKHSRLSFCMTGNHY